MQLKFTKEWGELVQEVVDDMLAEQWRDDWPDADSAPPSPSGEYFCGCPTCERRETLCLAVMLGIVGYLSGDVELIIEDGDGDG